VRGDATGTGSQGSALHAHLTGLTDTDFISSTRDPDELASLTARRDAMAMPPQAVAQTIAFAIAQPDSVDIGEVIVRPTVQPWFLCPERLWLPAQQARPTVGSEPIDAQIARIRAITGDAVTSREVDQNERKRLSEAHLEEAQVGG
jgi:hypothetical protein